MSKAHPHILYVGNPAQGKELLDAVQARGWWVETAEEAGAAMAMYVMNWPDVVVIEADGDTAMAAEVYHHLRSIQAGPILVLTVDPRWDYAAGDTVYTMLPPQNSAELVEFIDDVLSEEPVGALFRLAFDGE